MSYTRLRQALSAGRTGTRTTAIPPSSRRCCGRGVIENKHPTDVDSANRVRTPVWALFLNGSHALMLVKCISQ